MWLIVICTFLLSVFIIIRSLKTHYSYILFIILCLLFIWELCALSDTKMWAYVVSLLVIDIIAYKFKSIKSVSCSLIGLVFLVSLTPGISDIHFAVNGEMYISPKDSIDDIEDKDNLSLKVEGVRMGSAYKGSYNALQGCTIYKGKLYQFFNNGYYEIRNIDNMQLESEGRVTLPVRVHYGSVQFSDRISAGCSMPYLYATDDAYNEGNVYKIDFEKQEIIANYNVVGGGVAAYDFSKNVGYLIDTNNNVIQVASFDLISGKKTEFISLSADESLEILQSAVFHNGYIYILSGYTGRSLIISKIDLDNRRIVARKDYIFNGEPEGLFFRRDGKIVITAVVGSWNDVVGSDEYVHSEYVMIDGF